MRLQYCFGLIQADCKAEACGSISKAVQKHLSMLKGVCHNVWNIQSEASPSKKKQQTLIRELVFADDSTKSTIWR